MADTIEQWYIDTYCTNVEHALQQSESILAPTVRAVEMKGAKRRMNYIGTREPVEIKGRWEDTVVADSKYSVRWLFAKRYGDAFTVDEEDVERSFTDPTSDQTVASVRGMNRLKDRVIIAGLTAAAITGENADESVAFPAAQKMNIQLGSPSASPVNTGLTLAKLKRAKFMLDRAQLGKDDPRYCAVTAWQIQNLLDTTEITNADYNTVRALVSGQIDTFLGFKFVPVELLPYDDSTHIRSCYIYTRNSIGFGVSKGLTAKCAPVPQKNFQEICQLQIRLSSVRIHDEGVIEVPCHENPAEM